MEKNSTDSYKYEKAKQRVVELKKFYEHLIKFLIISVGLAALNYYQNSWNYPWFLWAVGSWGLGIGFHAFGTFFKTPIFGKNWEEKKIKELLESQEQKERWE